MAWDQYNIYRFTVNSNTYYFAPTELVGFGPAWNERTNQVVQEAENGEVRVLQLDANTRRDYVFKIKRMPWTDRTEGSYTIRGMSSLLTMIRTDAQYRFNTIEFWDRNASKAGAKTADVRFWADNFGIETSLRVAPDTSGTPGAQYFGTGQESITFRLEIA